MKKKKIRPAWCWPITTPTTTTSTFTETTSINEKNASKIDNYAIRFHPTTHLLILVSVVAVVCCSSHQLHSSKSDSDTVVSSQPGTFSHHNNSKQPHHQEDLHQNNTTGDSCSSIRNCHQQTNLSHANSLNISHELQSRSSANSAFESKTLRVAIGLNQMNEGGVRNDNANLKKLLINNKKNSLKNTLGANGLLLLLLDNHNHHRVERSTTNSQTTSRQLRSSSPSLSGLRQDGDDLNDGHLLNVDSSPSSVSSTSTTSSSDDNNNNNDDDDAMQIDASNNNKDDWLITTTSTTTTTTADKKKTNKTKKKPDDDDDSGSDDAIPQEQQPPRPQLMMTANKGINNNSNNALNGHTEYDGSVDRAQQQVRHHHHHANDGENSGNNNNVNLNDGQMMVKAEALVAIDNSDNKQQDLTVVNNGANPDMTLPTTITEGGSNQQVGVHIIKLIAPESIENGTANVTMDCLLKYDKTFDRRLTIKWFHNDDVVPIYQYIPELNSRTYSDKYEQYLDKSYDVTQDPQMILAAYMTATGQTGPNGAPSGSNDLTYLADATPSVVVNNNNNNNKWNHTNNSNNLIDGQQIDLDNYLFIMNNNLLMDETTKYRGLKLIRPTSGISGKFTCSVSSLESYDTKSSQLIVYAPAKKFNFHVTKVTGGYNLTCSADGVFPEPKIYLYRYRSSFIEPDVLIHHHGARQKGLATKATNDGHAARVSRVTRATSTNQQQQQQHQHHLYHANWISNSMMKPELLHDSSENTYSRRYGLATNNGDNTFKSNNGGYNNGLMEDTSYYEIQTHAYVDETTLSSQIATHFECALSIDGTPYKRQQTLAIQRGWHTNSAAITTSRQNMIGLISGIASLIIILSALVSIMMVFKLLKSYMDSRKVAQAPTT